MNNSFSQCVADICGLELATLINDYKYSIYGGRTAVIEGHNGIAEYSAEMVSFTVKKGMLRVLGNDLHIKWLEKHFAVVVGKINSVEVMSNEK